MRKLATLSLILVFIISSLTMAQFKEGQKAPDFTLPDLDGNYVTLSEIVGDGPVYINFWATWCGPCKKEIPHLIELYHEYQDRGFKVLAISTDNARTAGKVRAFVKDRGMDFTILLDSSKEVFGRKYKGRGIPYGFLIDNDGNIVYSARGFMPGLDKIIEEKMMPYLQSDSEESGSEAEGEEIEGESEEK